MKEEGTGGIAPTKRLSSLWDCDMIDFSIIIPTYNGEKRLPEVLEKLQIQVNTETISWEVIVVDNNSQDQTQKIVEDFQKTWQSQAPLKYCFEAKQGLAYTRERGVNEAQGTWIGFLDDDNVPTETWVFEAYQFGENHPKVGAFGGKVLGDFEVEPPANFESISGFLALRNRGEIPNLYQPEILSLPTGAGLVVRKQVWCDCLPKQSKFIGRLGKSLVGGEDWEPLLYMHQKGWEIWYNPAMIIYHKIPATRLQRDYLLNLIDSSCLPFCSLRMITAEPWEKPMLLFRMIGGNIYRALLYFIQHRHQLQTDLVAECELQMYWSRVKSPFYWLKLKLGI